MAWHVQVSALVVGLTTVIGVLLYYLVGSSLGFTVGYALPIASGVTLYVAASDLMPEVNKEPGGRMALIVFAGVGIFLALDWVLRV